MVKIPLKFPDPDPDLDDFKKLMVSGGIHLCYNFNEHSISSFWKVANIQTNGKKCWVKHTLLLEIIIQNRLLTRCL